MKKGKHESDSSEASKHGSDGIVIIDHAGLRSMRKNKRTERTPIEIMTLAKTRCNNILYACLYTDRNCLPKEPWLQENEIWKWKSAGFEIVQSPRRPNDKQTARSATTKETIDNVLIEGAHRIAKMIEEREAPVRFIFIIGDEDYLPLTLTLHARGFHISVFLTNECSFLDPQKASHVDDRLILYNQDTKDMSHKFGSAAHQVFGILRNHYRISTKQKTYLDRLSASTVLCPECGRETKLGLWLTHECHPSRVYMVESPRFETGIVQAGLPTHAVIKRVCDLLERYDARQFINWYVSQMQEGMLPEFMTYILTQLRTIPWEVVEVARLFNQIYTAEESVTVDDVISTFKTETLQLAAELNVITSDNGEELNVPPTIVDSFAPLMEHAEILLRYESISRAINRPGEGALQSQELYVRIFERDVNEPTATYARAVPKRDVRAIETALQNAASPDELIYWLVDRERVDRSQDEVEAVQHIISKHPDGALRTWLTVLSRIERELDIERYGLEIANLVAEWAGTYMTASAISILITMGILHNYGGANTWARGYASHPAFAFTRQLLKQKPLRDAS